MAEKAVFAEQELIFGFNEMFYCFLSSVIPAPFALTIGEKYRVVWGDDGAFDVTALDTSAVLPGTISIGNGSAYGFPGNNEPFMIVASDTDVSFISTVDTEAKSRRIAVYQLVDEDKEYLIWGSTLKGIANAIRSKTGEAGEIAVTDMATKISGITGGGGGSSDVEVVYVTFMSHDGTTELHKRAVLPGNDCMEIVSGGVMDAPTRESTNTRNYTFAGWATEVNGGLNENALKNVTEDRTVYANYIGTTRYYTVRFFDGDTLLNTMQVEYGASANYTTEKEGYQFNGWNPDNTNITADTDCYAQWATAITFANATWAQIAEISESGEAANYFKVGDTKEIPYGNYTITVAIAGFNHDNLADGSGKAGISIVTRTLPDVAVKWNAAYNSSHNYPYANEHTTSASTRNSLPRATLSGTVFNALPAELQAVIKPVSKSYDKSQAKGAASLATATDKLWLLSLDEMGHNWATEWTTSNISALGSKYELFSSADYIATGYNFQAILSNGFTGANVQYWTRSIVRSGSVLDPWVPYVIKTDGKALSHAYNSTNANSSTTRYLCFGFCI